MTPRELFDTLVYDAGKSKFEMLQIIESICDNLSLSLLEYFINEFEEIGTQYEMEDINYDDIVKFDHTLLTWKIHNRGLGYKYWQINEELGGNASEDNFHSHSHFPNNYEFVLSQLKDRAGKQERRTDTVNTSKIKGRPVQDIKSRLIGSDEVKEYTLRVLHEMIRGKTGKDVALIISAAIEAGRMTKPTFTEVKQEFGEGVGNVSGYNKYIRNKKEVFTREEIDGIANILRNIDVDK